MAWQQLKLQTTAEHIETLSTLLNLFGAKAVTLLDAADQPILEPLPGATPVWEQTWLVGLFDLNTDLTQVLAFIQARFDTHILLNHVIEPVAEQDWERVWLVNFKPMQFGQRLWICPSAYTPPEPDAVNILLDPGLAFGTGTHPTTALCLVWLDQNPPTNLTVLDYGCGSGILAIAALKLGASQAWAVDHDEQALEATRANAQRNAIDPTTLQTILPAQLPALQVDYLLANILAAPLIELMPHFAKLLKPNGKIILSGMLAAQTSAVIDAYSSLFNLAVPQHKEEWILLEGLRK